MQGELWLLVLVLREAARALSPEPGAGRTGQSWPRGPVAAGGGAREGRGVMLAEGRQAGVGMGRYRSAGDVRGESIVRRRPGALWAVAGGRTETLLY